MFVLPDVPGLHNPDELHCGQEGDRDNIVKQDQEPQEGRQGLRYNMFPSITAVCAQVQSVVCFVIVDASVDVKSCKDC